MSTDIATHKISVLEMPSPGLPGFDYIRAHGAAEVSDLLLRYGSAARLLMGGTDLFVQLRDGLLAPQVVIDVKHLPDLAGIDFDPDTGLRIGAAVSMNAMAAHPAVIAHYPIKGDVKRIVFLLPGTPPKIIEENWQPAHIRSVRPALCPDVD